MRSDFGRNVYVGLCELTGNMARPWLDMGYTAILIDPQHPKGIRTSADGMTMTIGAKIDSPDAWDILRMQCWHASTAFMAAFPPCTDLAISGAAHFQSKAQRDAGYLAKAMETVHQCVTIGELLGCPYLVENPVSTIASLWREPNHYFDPCDYTAYAIEDNYTKRTGLWTGGGFVMPTPRVLDGLPDPIDRTSRINGGNRANLRSATPKGFARAVAAQHSDF